MASEIKSQVDSQLNSQSINTKGEVDTFRQLGRTEGDMRTVIANIESSVGHWVSRKRVRHETLRLYHEGSL